MNAQMTDETQDQTASTATEQTPATAMEVFDSLTGFDEIAIRQQFGATVEALFDRSPGRELPRALAFVLHRRDGVKDADAYERAMGASLGDTGALFGEEPEEIDPDEPDTPVGKDADKPAKKRSTSRASSSSE